LTSASSTGNLYRISIEQQDEAFKQKIQKKNKALTDRKKLLQVQKGHSNGYRHIKHRLAESNRRIGAVKVHFLTQFGVSISSVCHNDVREHTYDQSVSASSKETTQINWNRLELDLDKQSYYKGLYNKYDEASSAPESGTTVSTKNANPQKDKSPNIKVALTAKQMETELGITRKQSDTLNFDRFFSTRQEFYEQQSRLSILLSSELDRLDYQRKPAIEAKSRAFTLTNVTELYVEGTTCG
jgi:hypothetical protein